MTTLRWILLRYCAATWGRLPGMDRFLRRLVYGAWLKDRQSRYVPASNFFSPGDLKE